MCRRSNPSGSEWVLTQKLQHLQRAGCHLTLVPHHPIIPMTEMACCDLWHGAIVVTQLCRSAFTSSQVNWHYSLQWQHPELFGVVSWSWQKTVPYHRKKTLNWSKLKKLWSKCCFTLHQNSCQTVLIDSTLRDELNIGNW